MHCFILFSEHNVSRTLIVLVGDSVIDRHCEGDGVCQADSRLPFPADDRPHNPPKGGMSGDHGK